MNAADLCRIGHGPEGTQKIMLEMAISGGVKLERLVFVFMHMKYQSQSLGHSKPITTASRSCCSKADSFTNLVTPRPQRYKSLAVVVQVRS